MVGEDLESTGEAAFSTDCDGRVVEWNESAERLLGYARKEVVGKPCHAILQGCDPAGNRCCLQWCVPREMAERGEPIHSYPMDTRTRSGATIRVACTILVIRDSASRCAGLVHVIRALPSRTDAYGEDEPPAAGKTNQEKGLLAAASGEQLTARELEVLRLLTTGAATQVIAESLFISKQTVRTHVQSILRKLGCHSKLEAVVIAVRRRLIQML